MSETMNPETGELLDGSVYLDPEIPMIDGYPAFTAEVAFAGKIGLNLRQEEDRAIYRALTLGTRVTVKADDVELDALVDSKTEKLDGGKVIPKIRVNVDARALEDEQEGEES